MIVGIGTDIVEIERIAALYQKKTETFAKRILSATELPLLAMQAHPHRFLAKRWAGKEAISKALGTGFTQGVSFVDMTIEHTEEGQPYVVLQGKALERASSLGVQNWSLSLSDEQSYAVAFAVAEK